MRAREVAFLEAGEHLVERHAHKRTAERLVHATAEPLLDLADRLAEQGVVEEALDRREILGENFLGELHLAVEHLTVLGDDDDERALRRERHERDLADAHVEHGRRQHDRQAIGQTGKRRGGLLEQRVELASRPAHLLGDLAVALVVGGR